MGHEKITKAAALHLVPEFIFLRAGDAEDALRPLGEQRFHEGAGASHVPLDPTIRGTADRFRGCRHQGRRGGQGAGSGSFQGVAASDLRRHKMLHIAPGLPGDVFTLGKPGAI